MVEKDAVCSLDGEAEGSSEGLPDRLRSSVTSFDMENVMVSVRDGVATGVAVGVRNIVRVWLPSSVALGVGVTLADTVSEAEPVQSFDSVIDGSSETVMDSDPVTRIMEVENVVVSDNVTASDTVRVVVFVMGTASARRITVDCVGNARRQSMQRTTRHSSPQWRNEGQNDNRVEPFVALTFS